MSSTKRLYMETKKQHKKLVYIRNFGITSFYFLHSKSAINMRNLVLFVRSALRILKAYLKHTASKKQETLITIN